jgi:mannose-6-phosphate isomerase
VTDLPFLLPLLPNRVWRTYLGGRTLDAIEGRSAPADSHFPEDWIASDTKAVNPGREHVPGEGFSSVLHRGFPILLRDLFANEPEAVLGRAYVQAHGCSLGFLVKLLDSAIRLHIQVHPTTTFSRAHLGADAGKTEAYVILTCRDDVPEPAFYFGFRTLPGVGRLRQIVEEQQVNDLLRLMHRVPVSPGDAFLVPGGVPHAIGEGVLMIEIMEPTDFVARFEFERGGYTLPPAARFLGRDLDFALSMLDLRAYAADELKAAFFASPLPVDPGRPGVACESLIDSRLTDRFTVKRYRASAPFVLAENSFFVMVVTHGQGIASCPHSGGSDLRPFRAYDRFFVPFASRVIEVAPEREVEIVVILPPHA